MICNDERIDLLMKHALELAYRAAAAGEVPVGAVIGDENGIFASRHNEVESLNDTTAHAEILAIREASEKMQNWRLNNTVLVVTLEPCPMCAGAIRNARIPCVVFGAFDPERGAFGSRFDLSKESRLGPVPEVRGGIREAECGAALKEFFQKRRN
ncbi:MAG: nucleoside deaminase [Bdellovibrionales bacterium]|nr:nucleoside deaminase [Bdellovibrionales bacterium]